MKPTTFQSLLFASQRLEQLDDQIRSAIADVEAILVSFGEVIPPAGDSHERPLWVGPTKNGKLRLFAGPTPALDLNRGDRSRVLRDLPAFFDHAIEYLTEAKR